MELAGGTGATLLAWAGDVERVDKRGTKKRKRRDTVFVCTACMVAKHTAYPLYSVLTDRFHMLWAYPLHSINRQIPHAMYRY